MNEKKQMSMHKKGLAIILFAAMVVAFGILDKENAFSMKVVAKNVSTSDTNENIYTVSPEKQEQTIIVNKQYSCTYGDESFSLDAESDGDGKITYTSENPDVVTISEEGMVSIIGAGSAEIIVEAKETEIYASAITKVKVVVSPCSIGECQAIFAKVGEFSDKEENIEKYVILMDGNKVLIEGKDYEHNGANMTSANNKVSSISITVEGKGNYTGSNTWKLSPISQQPLLQSAKLTKQGIQLTWQKETGGIGYCIYRKKGNGNYKKIKTISKNGTTTWLDNTDLQKGEKYTYRMRVYTKNNEQIVYSNYSVEKSVQTSGMAIKISGKAYYNYAFQILKLVNKEREKRKLSPLVMDKNLLSSAMVRGAEINLYFGHTRPDGSDCFTTLSDDMMQMGENIAAGQKSPTEVVNDWMNSPGHKANILDDGYNVIGVGCYKAGNCYYWVQMFGQKSSANKAVKANYKDGKKTMTVRAEQSFVSIQMSISKKTIKKGATQKIQMKVTNKRFSYDSITLPNSQFTFSSSNTKIAKVSSKGVVKGYKKGKAKITAKFTNSGKTVGKTITVVVK